MMADILKFQSNDNYVISICFEETLKIIIKTWDEKLFQVEFDDCYKFKLDTGIEFEIGEIEIKSFQEFDSEWEMEFVKENGGCSDYYEIIFYDAWENERKNMMLIYSSCNIKRL
ncbi:MAG: hypothetical protein IKL31_08445 [Ruminococcus sp.]|nr:hypothetical protein [Ruminococcus sp.]